MEDSLERTLVLIKPDGVQRSLIGEVIRRLESRGLRIVAARFQRISREFARQHYAIHEGKPFFENLMAMVWEGPNAIAAVRQTMGATNPLEAAPGSVRHDFGLEIGRNLTHASDSVETAKEEIKLWFSPEELVAWERSLDRWIFE